MPVTSMWGIPCIDCNCCRGLGMIWNLSIEPLDISKKHLPSAWTCGSGMACQLIQHVTRTKVILTIPMDERGSWWKMACRLMNITGLNQNIYITIYPKPPHITTNQAFHFHNLFVLYVIHLTCNFSSWEGQQSKYPITKPHPGHKILFLNKRIREFSHIATANLINGRHLSRWI